MRVTHVGAGNLFGGIERLLVSYARNRDACGAVEPSYTLCFEGRLSAELASCGVPMHVIGPVRMSRPWTLWGVRTRMAALLQERKPDAVVCHSYWPHAVFAPVIRAAGLPLVFAAHDVPTGKHWLELLARQTTPDLVVANSHHTKAAVTRLFPNVRTEVHYGPVGPAAAGPLNAERAPVRSSLGAPQSAAVIITACRLERWKGHRLLLGALARLERSLDWQCWIVGGPQRPKEQRYLTELRQAATESNLEDRVRFLGQRDDVPRLMAAADIHCQPNEGPEPFGVAFVEALYAGLPVVTTAHGGGAEIVDGRCGALTPPGDASALAGALDALIRDPQRRAALGAGGPIRARELCDPAVVIPRFYRSLEGLCRPNGAVTQRIDGWNAASCHQSIGQTTGANQP